MVGGGKLIAFFLVTTSSLLLVHAQTPVCNLPQCPSQGPQVNHANGTYYRPPGCTGEYASASDPSTAFFCRLPDASLAPPSEYAPQQVHVQPANTKFTSFFIVWATGHAVDPVPEVPSTLTYGAGQAPSSPNDAGSYVWYSASKAAVTQALDSVRHTASKHDSNQVYTSLDGQYHSPIFHTLEVGPLQTNTRYYYRVGDPSKPEGVSALFSFVVPPSASKPKDAKKLYPFRLGMTADIGQTYNSSTTLKHLYANKPAGVLVVGDLSYADDYQLNNRYGYQPRWDTWGRLTQQLFSSVPTTTALGNHEEEAEQFFGDSTTLITRCVWPDTTPPTPGAIGGSGGDCARSWIHRYPTPYKSAGAEQPFWYSYNIGPAHIIVLSVYSPSCTGNSLVSASCPGTPSLGLQAPSPQYTWLLQDLAAVDRTTTPWLIVAFHEPYYSTADSYSTSGGYQHALLFQQHLEPVFYANGVDFIITGHVHAYERTYPVFNFTVNQCAPIYLGVGDAGNEEGPSEFDTKFGDPISLTASEQPWSAYREGSFGHGLLDLLSPDTAQWMWHRNQDPTFSIAADTLNVTRATYENGCTNRPPASKK